MTINFGGVKFYTRKVQSNLENSGNFFPLSKHHIYHVIPHTHYYSRKEGVISFLTVVSVSWCSGRVGQTTLIPVSLDAQIKEKQGLATHLGPVMGHNLVVHKHGEDGSLHEGREERLAVGRLV